MQKTFPVIRIYQLLLVALILLLLWKWNCGGTCPAITETVKTDTVWKTRVDSSSWSKPEPVAIKPGKTPAPRIQIVEVPGQAIPDTIWIPVDTAAILSEYFAVVDYDTTYHFLEGDISVQNTVTENRINRQRVLPTFNIPEITTTITQALKKKRQFYFGVDGYGGKEIPLFGAGASIMYKDRKDRVYEFGPVLLKDQPVMFRGGLKFLISFK